MKNKNTNHLAINLRNYLEEAEEISRYMDLDYHAIYEDAYAIFESNPTREGATEAAELFVSVITEAADHVVSETRELITVHALNRQQRRALKIDKRLETFEHHMKLALETYRADFIENAVNGTMERSAEAAGEFSRIMEEALFR